MKIFEPIKDLKYLRWLNLNKNEIENILSNLNNLRNLKLSKNKIKFISNEFLIT